MALLTASVLADGVHARSQGVLGFIIVLGLIAIAWAIISEDKD